MVFFPPFATIGENIEVQAMGSRMGKHRRDKVRVGLYMTIADKAVAAVTAQVFGMTMSDLILAGVKTLARQRGILDATGAVSKDFADDVDNATVFIEQNNEVDK